MKVNPYVDGRLLDGSRIKRPVIPPLSLNGPILTIRKFSKRKLNVEDLVAFGSLTQEAADFPRGMRNVEKEYCRFRGNWVPAKPRFLNILSNFIPPNERIVTIEDSAELQLSQDHVIRLESRPSNLEGKGQVAIRDLVINALRMRPDRIVIGECRGGEALDMLQAMNTGHDGSLTTAHANSPRDVLSRLETMCLFTGLDLPAKGYPRANRPGPSISSFNKADFPTAKDPSLKFHKFKEWKGMSSSPRTYSNGRKIIGFPAFPSPHHLSRI